MTRGFNWLTRSRSNGNCGAADITLKEAVEYLSHSDKAYQRCGASYIWHKTFADDSAKEQVILFLSRYEFLLIVTF